MAGRDLFANRPPEWLQSVGSKAAGALDPMLRPVYDWATKERPPEKTVLEQRIDPQVQRGYDPNWKAAPTMAEQLTEKLGTPEDLRKRVAGLMTGSEAVAKE